MKQNFLGLSMTALLVTIGANVALADSIRDSETILG